MTPIREIIEKLFHVEAKRAVMGKPSDQEDATPSKIVPFKLNPPQAELDESITPDRRFHIILKARQLGMSTYVEARFLAKCLTQKSVHAVVISHEREATTRLLRRVHFFIDQLEESQGIKVPKEFDSKHEVTFPKTGSSFYLGTAGQRSFGRGDTITDIHASEPAFWDTPSETMRGLLGALTPEGEVILESTANGMGGYFYDTFEKSKAKDSEWTGHFYPWSMDPAYCVDAPRDFAPTTDESYLMRAHRLSPGQICWRRKKLDVYSSIEEFQAEYPLSPEEAFIVTGTVYFDRAALRVYQRLIKDPIAVGSAEMLGDRAQFMRAEEGPLSVWDFPKAGIDYIIAADCSEGVEGGDYFAAVCLNRDRVSHDATLYGHIDPADAAVQLYAMGRLYNWALIAVEDNGPGLACLLKLRELRYPRLYIRKVLDLDTQEQKEKLGWHTDHRSRTLALGDLRQAIKRQRLLTRDKRFLQEMTTFCKQKDNTYKANSGCHDDLVISMAVAVYLDSEVPKRRDFDPLERGYGRMGMPAAGNSKTGY